MSALELAATMGFADYRPNLVVDAVGELLPHGRDGALDRVDAEAREHPGVGLFWVLRVLFDPPLPEVRIGAPNPPPPEDAEKLLPRYPVLLALDVPFLLVRGYELGGKGQPVGAHVSWLREHGRLRAEPLRPAGDPEAVRDAAVAEWRGAFGSAGLEQVLPLIDRQLIGVDA